MLDLSAEPLRGPLDEGGVESALTRGQQQVHRQHAAAGDVGKHRDKVLLGGGVSVRVQNEGEAARPAPVVLEAADLDARGDPGFGAGLA